MTDLVLPVLVDGAYALSVAADQPIVAAGRSAVLDDEEASDFGWLAAAPALGDVVDVGTAIGTVESVGLRVTKIRDSDGVLWYVPNGSVLRVGNKTQGWSNAVVAVKDD